ncbi:LysR family transcriptional regulator [Puniceibacterium confluentis]|uniref:LysR family transcriptional regulator n=1 Tax=Puniceibacterium confluentis TaxID=1958944 RepID=UPI001647EB32|nr:LysR family transcriptional regulator [Puniceibacterium confluentis]
MRLFARTTRAVHATEHGRLFYDDALGILDAIGTAEATVKEATQSLTGTLCISAPLGLGHRIAAPAVPRFKQMYPEFVIRLRHRAES